MSKQEKFLVEQKLNQLRARFINPEGLLDRVIMDKYYKILMEVKKLGFRVELDDRTNKLFLEKIA